MHILIVLIRLLKLLLLYEITKPLDICVRQYPMHWIIKYSNEHGVEILYAPYIFMDLMKG